MPVSGAPFQDAVANAQADPSQGAGVDGEMGDYAPGSFVPGQEPIPLPKFYGGSATVIGRMRDQLMEQFPGVNLVQDAELEMTAQAKMGFFAFAISNPQGALDIVRDRQARHAKRKARAAAMNLKMLEISKDVISSQDRTEQAMFTARQSAATAERQDRQLELNEEVQMGMLDMREAEVGLKRQAGEREAENQAIVRATMGERFGMGGGGGVEFDEGGAPMTVPHTAGSQRPDFETSFNVGKGGVSMALKPQDRAAQRQKAFMNYVAVRTKNKIGQVTEEDMIQLAQAFNRQYPEAGARAEPMGFGENPTAAGPGPISFRE